MIEEFRKPEIKPKNRIKNRLHLISMIDSYKKKYTRQKSKTGDNYIYGTPY